MSDLFASGRGADLRAALTGVASTAIAPWLLVVFAAHIADVISR